jgi:pyruvate/2-oxoglutarate dehydrogenase complex dihydrolipoamide acyltransferase (E2) component
MVSPLALAVAGFAKALKGFPSLNACLDGDVVRSWTTVNVNVLMDADGELVNPVVHAAEAKEVPEIARLLGDLQKRAAERKLVSADVADGTVTITSLVGTGVTHFVPIVYPGQTAILGLADVDPYSSPKTMAWALTFDHRVANAMTAARLLKRMLEEVTAL